MSTFVPPSQLPLPGLEPAVPAAPELRPIDRLVPNSELHNAVRQKLLDRISLSERKMNQFYSRWRYNEKKMQAHIDLPQYEQLLKQLSVRDATPPPVVSITVPYSFATIWTIVTYLANTFLGRKPIFQVASNKAEMVKSAENMEIKLQYDADHTKLVKELFQFFLDGEIYGVAVMRTLWKVEKKNRTIFGPMALGGNLAPDTPQVRTRQREKRVVYEGNGCKSIDPFMFFPDPRVPMANVAREGEFVFWRNFLGSHILMKAQADGELLWVDKAKKTLPQNSYVDSNGSQRGLMANGDSSAGNMESGRDGRALPYFQVDQGTVELVPMEWGLGESTEIEKWIFTLLNKDQICQAEPLDLDHDMHPVAVSEPYSFGYGFGNVGLTDMLGPLQDTVSWFINSHIHNVRSTLNNSFIVNPSAIEMQDLKNPAPGKLIRLKPSAYGVDVRTIIQQLSVMDVTQQNINDMQTFIRMGDSLSSVNDNIRGVQTSGGRKTATEVRTAGEASGSRLASHASYISAQAIVDLTEQMCLNNQQNLSDEFYAKVVGAHGMEDRIIRPEDLVGDFYYPVSDGTLPIDKVAVLDIWREILTGVMSDPQLRASYDVTKLFEFVAELGGARNITSFKLLPQDQIQQQLQSGNMLPVPGGGGAGGLPPELAALASLGG